MHNATTLLAKAILARGQTSAEAAAALGINAGTLSRILNGKQIPGKATRQKLAVTYGVPLKAWPPLAPSTGIIRRIAAGEDGAA